MKTHNPLLNIIWIDNFFSANQFNIEVFTEVWHSKTSGLAVQCHYAHQASGKLEAPMKSTTISEWPKQETKAHRYQNSSDGAVQIFIERFYNIIYVNSNIIYAHPLSSLQLDHYYSFRMFQSFCSLMS